MSRRVLISSVPLIALFVFAVAWRLLDDDTARIAASPTEESDRVAVSPPVSIVYLATPAGRPAKVMMRDLRDGQERSLGDSPAPIVNVVPLIVVSGPYAYVSHFGSLMRYSLSGPPMPLGLGTFQNGGVVAAQNGLWVPGGRRSWRFIDWDGKTLTTVEDSVDDSLPVGAAADGLVLHQGTTGETVFLDRRGVQSFGKVFPVAAGGRHVVFIRDTNLIALDLVTMKEITVGRVAGETPSSTFSGRISPDGNRVVIPLKTDSDYRPTRTLVVDL